MSISHSLLFVFFFCFDSSAVPLSPSHSLTFLWLLWLCLPQLFLFCFRERERWLSLLLGFDVCGSLRGGEGFFLGGLLFCFLSELFLGFLRWLGFCWFWWVLSAGVSFWVSMRVRFVGFDSILLSELFMVFKKREREWESWIYVFNVSLEWWRSSLDLLIRIWSFQGVRYWKNGSGREKGERSWGWWRLQRSVSDWYACSCGWWWPYMPEIARNSASPLQLSWFDFDLSLIYASYFFPIFLGILDGGFSEFWLIMHLWFVGFFLFFFNIFA